MQIDAKFIILFFGPIRLERPMSKSRDAELILWGYGYD